jgi:uncharacterized membrane protein
MSAPSSVQVPSLSAVAATGLTISYCLFFGWLSLRAYWAFQMHALDMGNMAQAAWNTIHGQPFRFTNMYPLYANIEAWGTTTRLSFHVEFLFPLISLIYLVYPHPESLLVLQTLAIGAGAIPVYLLGRQCAGSWLAVALVAAYLLFPSTEALNLYEFHPVSLATPLLLYAFVAAFQRRYLLFALSALAAMGTKEQIGLVVAMLGLYIAVVNRNRLLGLGVAILSTTWSLAAASVIEEHFRYPGARSYLHSRYSYILQGGHGLQAVVHTIMHDPQTFWFHLATWPKADFVFHLTSPLGFLPFAGAPFLLLGAPSVAIDLLSTDPHMYSALGDNSAELIAVTMIAATLGAGVLLRLLRPRLPGASWIVAAVLVSGSLWQQHTGGFTPLGPRFQLPVVGAHQRVQNAFVNMVPPGAPVSTSDVLDPHLSNRRYVYLYPLIGSGALPGEDIVPVRDILLDVSTPVYPIPPDQQYTAASRQIGERDWGVAGAQDGLILIARGARRKSIPAAFYSYFDAPGPPTHRLSGSAHGMKVVGYDRRETDLANHRIPVLAYSVYLRPTRRVPSLQPVLYETVHGRLIGCDPLPLGLSWKPTNQWSRDHTYLVHMQPLETQWDGGPVTIHMHLSLQPSRPETDGCAVFWGHRTTLWPVGELSTGQ